MTLILLCVFVVRCAPVNFYSDAALTKKTGLKFFTVKPYVQIEREAETGGIIKMTVLYLPDLSDPQYLSIKSGPGSAKADIKLSDGIVTTFGFESDKILPESIESIAKLISGSAGAIEDLSSLKGQPGLKASTNRVSLYEVVIKDGKTSLIEVSPDK